MIQKKMGAAAAIFNGEREILLVKHSYGNLNWELPGGAAENSESITQTALREVREEIGWEIVAERLTGIYFDASEDFHHFVFQCRVLDSKLIFQPNAEITHCAYWPLNGLPRPISDFTMQRIWDAAQASDLVLPTIISGRKWFE